MPNPFNDPRLRDWFLEDEEHWHRPAVGVPVRRASAFPEAVVSMGEGPFAENDFDEFLRDHGVEPHLPDDELDHAVVGRSGWGEEELERLVAARSGSTLKVYSQEMFVAYVATGVDPFSKVPLVVRAFGREHPALQFLTRLGFDWPTTHVVLGLGVGLEVTRPAVGFLRSMGYRVGRSGRSRSERRRILRQVYRSRVPESFDADYRAEWGNPNTCSRLRKMANTIASLCRNQRRRFEPPMVAIMDWDEDLAWLRTEYYHGHCRFEWPSTLVL